MSALCLEARALIIVVSTARAACSSQLFDASQKWLCTLPVCCGECSGCSHDFPSDVHLAVATGGHWQLYAPAMTEDGKTKHMSHTVSIKLSSPLGLPTVSHIVICILRS